MLPGVSLDQGHQIADQIHNSGQAIVWTGPREPAEHYWEQLEVAGLTAGVDQAAVEEDLEEAGAAARGAEVEQHPVPAPRFDRGEIAVAVHRARCGTK